MLPRHHYREELEHQLNKGALWAVTYGDLMSYLMILFLVLFSFSVSRVGHVKEGKKVDESLATIQKVFGGKESKEHMEKRLQKEREEAAAKQVEQTIENKNLNQYVNVTTTEEKVKLELKERVLFDSGHAELKEAAQPILKEISNAIKNLSNEIVVEGHTDNVPIHSGKYKSNWELSMARAYEVIRFFEDMGIDSSRLSGIGYGQYRPEGDNSTVEGRAQNRRIGITLLRKQ